MNEANRTAAIALVKVAARLLKDADPMRELQKIARAINTKTGGSRKPNVGKMVIEPDKGMGARVFIMFMLPPDDRSAKKTVETWMTAARSSGSVFRALQKDLGAAMSGITPHVAHNPKGATVVLPLPASKFKDFSKAASKMTTAILKAAELFKENLAASKVVGPKKRKK